MSAAQEFRNYLKTIELEGLMVIITKEVDPHLEAPSIIRALHKLKNVPALLFENIAGYPQMKGCAGFMARREAVFKALRLPLEHIRAKEKCIKAIENPVMPIRVKDGACKNTVVLQPRKIEDLIFPTLGSSESKTYYYQPVVFTKHPVTGEVNLGLYRVAIQEEGKVTVNLRVTQHGGMQLQAAKEKQVPLQVACCLGVHPAIYLAACSELSYGYNELGFAGALLGEPIEIVKCETVDIEVPSSAEIVIEGEIRPPYELGSEGPWPEYLDYLGMNIHPPKMDVTAITFRDNPINPLLIPGTVPNMWSVGNEAQLLRTLRSFAGEFVVDACFTPGAKRHHAIIKVNKTSPHHEGYQLNVGLAAFGYGSATALDNVILVDSDINIYDYKHIDWAIATRCNPAEDVHILPQAKCHQNNPIAGVRELEGKPITKAKMIIDATIPWNYRVKQKEQGITFFTLSSWPEIELEKYFSERDKTKWLS